MKKIFIAATMQNDGKTTLSLGLIHALKKHFKRIGFIKPIGQRYLVEGGYKVDEDSVLIEHIYGSSVNIKDMSPVAIERGFTERYIDNPDKGSLEKKIKDSFDRISKDKDLVIIEGTGHAGVGSCFDLSNAVVAKMLGAKVILITEGGVGRPIDEIMLNKSLFDKEGVGISGVIVNKVLPKKYDKINKFVRKGFKRKGVNVFGVVEYNELLSKPTLQEILEEIKGIRFLQGDKERLHDLAHNILVGAMTPAGALKYITSESLLITAGDRTDLIDAVCKSQLKKPKNRVIGLVLSGGITPPKSILQCLKPLGIPVLISEHHTYKTAEAIHDIIVKIKPGDKQKIGWAIERIEKYVDVENIINAISK